MGFKVLIIGGGMGGLCLAQGLKKAGIEFELFERDKHKTDRIQGYRISIDPDGVSALRECLPTERFEKFVNSCGELDPSKPRSFCMLTSQLSELVKFDLPSSDFYPASRITLRKILLEGLESEVHFNKTFTHYTISADNRTVTAHFEDGTAVEGNLLVAADGGKSRVRQQMLPHAQRVETGNISIAAKIRITPEIKSSLPSVLFTGAAIAMAPDGWTMFLALHLSPKAASESQTSEDKTSLWLDDNAPYLMCAVGANEKKFSENISAMTKEELFAEMQYRVSSWHPYLQGLIASADIDTVNTLKITTSVPVDPWDSGLVTFVGDAIHSMTPYRGIGGNQALKDAEKLCKTIVDVAKGSKEELIPAIHEYEDEMLTRGFKCVETSLQSMRMLHQEGWRFTARNLGFRALNLMMHPTRVLFGEAN